jgi:zinc-ribbon domain
MQCRHCGTEIADKAIVCYRCGAATTDPVRKPVPVGRARSAPSLLSGIAILVLALIFLSFASASGYPRAMDAAAIALALVGAVVLGTRLVRRG